MINRPLVVTFLLCLCGSGLAPMPTIESAEAAEGSCARTKRGYRCMYGPFTVTEGISSLDFQAATIPRAGFITRGRVTVVDDAGNPVSGHHVHLHHSAWLDPTTPSLLCKGWPGSLVYMSSKERSRMRFPDGYGFYWKNIAPDPSLEAESETGAPYWRFVADLMGMHAGMEEEVFLRLSFSFKGEDAALEPVQTEFLSINHCRSPHTFDVVVGSGTDGRYRRSIDFEWPEDGRFVWGTGHLHDGGIKLSVQNVTRGERVYVSRALYTDRSDPWWLTGMTTWSSAEGSLVAGGDVMRLTATYDSTHDWDDVMGNLRITYTSSEP